MRKNYFFLAAASALVLASCSSESNEPTNIEKPIEKDGISMTVLDAASQAGRVKTYGTRGEKADRLELVATIAPVSDAASNKWSATGIAIANGTAYVSWHSNHQASDPALTWGGALDIINVANKSLTQTLTSNSAKFNNVVATSDGNLYFPLTSYKNGAMVGHLVAEDGENIMETFNVPGSSANSIYVNDGTLYVATGFNGGLYSLPATFNENSKATELAKATDFGGKYIDNGYLLRTDADHCYVASIYTPTTNVIEGMPLVSEEKNAEKYNEEDGWTTVDGKTSVHYGKHTMAVAGNYVYVAGGQGDPAAKDADGKPTEERGHKGLRVYDKTTGRLLWENGTTTTAVCVAGDYVYAATGAGLRVYKKYVAPTEEGKQGTLELYAMEVLDYDDDGKAADHGGSKAPQAGTNAKSCNFVAVDEATGYIFVANGQSGVSVFKLNHNVTPSTTPDNPAE